MDAEDILLRGTGVGGSLNLSASFFTDMLNSPDLGCSSIEATSFRAPEEHRPAKRCGNLPNQLAAYNHPLQSHCNAVSGPKEANLFQSTTLCRATATLYPGLRMQNYSKYQPLHSQCNAVSGAKKAKLFQSSTRLSGNLPNQLATYNHPLQSHCNAVSGPKEANLLPNRA